MPSITNHKTITTEITSSVVYIDGVATNDDNDTITLANAGAGYDGMLLKLKTLSDVDIDDSITVTVTNCDGCPFAGSFKMMNTGCLLQLRWDHANTTWQFESFYHPFTDWGASSVTTGFEDDPTPSVNDEVFFSVTDNQVFVHFDINGDSQDEDAPDDGDIMTFTVPYTSSATFPEVSVVCLTMDNDTWETAPGRIKLPQNSSTVQVFPGTDYIDGVWTKGGAGVNDKQKAVRGQFTYGVD